MLFCPLPQFSSVFLVCFKKYFVSGGNSNLWYPRETTVSFMSICSQQQRESTYVLKLYVPFYSSKLIGIFTVNRKFFFALSRLRYWTPSIVLTFLTLLHLHPTTCNSTRGAGTTAFTHGEMKYNFGSKYSNSQSMSPLEPKTTERPLERIGWK